MADSQVSRAEHEVLLDTALHSYVRFRGAQSERYIGRETDPISAAVRLSAGTVVNLFPDLEAVSAEDEKAHFQSAESEYVNFCMSNSLFSSENTAASYLNVACLGAWELAIQQRIQIANEIRLEAAQGPGQQAIINSLLGDHCRSDDFSRYLEESIKER